MANHLFELNGELLIKGFNSTSGGVPTEPGWSYIGVTPYTDASVLKAVEEIDELGEIRTVYVVCEVKLKAKQDAEAVALLANAWVELRAKRNALLTASDFAVLSDSPLSDAQKVAYVDYRAALRNVPQNTVDPLNPVWPVKP